VLLLITILTIIIVSVYPSFEAIKTITTTATVIITITTIAITGHSIIQGYTHRELGRTVILFIIIITTLPVSILTRIVVW
jgi:hypothetical protein